jgi:hypothetical protein
VHLWVQSSHIMLDGFILGTISANYHSWHNC